MTTEEQLQEAKLKIAFLENLVREQKNPTPEDDASKCHRSVCLIPKDIWIQFRSACPKLRITATKAYKLAIQSVIDLAK